MKASRFFLLLFIFFSISAFSLNSDIDNIIEIQIITKTASKTYYTIFSESDNSFIYYDNLY